MGRETAIGCGGSSSLFLELLHLGNVQGPVGQAESNSLATSTAGREVLVGQHRNLMLDPVASIMNYIVDPRVGSFLARFKGIADFSHGECLRQMVECEVNDEVQYESSLAVASSRSNSSLGRSASNK